MRYATRGTCSNRQVTIAAKLPVCANAALAAAAPEVKRAYLELEQAWLSLAPKVEIIDEDLIEPTPSPDVTLDTSPISKKKRR